jgi:curved DNA-binding protein CbpA
MIHHSYRQDGKVKKKQWVICTIGYYYLVESWVGDFIIRDQLNKKLSEMGITEEQLWDMVYEKLDPIIKQIKAEFESTEEYRVYFKHQKIIKEYNEAKQKFERLYGNDTYDYCYDVFGVLRNEGYLNELQDKVKREAEYRKSSYSNQYNSNYSSEGSNFNDSYSSYFKTSYSNYTDEEKSLLKKIYRSLSKNFHPDITKDDGEIMKLINKLKEGWGI